MNARVIVESIPPPVTRTLKLPLKGLSTVTVKVSETVLTVPCTGPVKAVPVVEACEVTIGLKSQSIKEPAIKARKRFTSSTLHIADEGGTFVLSTSSKVATLGQDRHS